MTLKTTAMPCKKEKEENQKHQARLLMLPDRSTAWLYFLSSLSLCNDLDMIIRQDQFTQEVLIKMVSAWRERFSADSAKEVQKTVCARGASYFAVSYACCGGYL